MNICLTRNGDVKDHGRYIKEEYLTLPGVQTTFIWAHVELIVL
jgi:hypothetical protein